MGTKFHRDWDGDTAVIVVGGSSLSLSQVRLIGLHKAADLVRVIAVNDAVYPCWFADGVLSCDAKWWLYHGPLPGFDGWKWRLDVPGSVAIPGVEVVSYSGDAGFDPRPDFIRTGRNGGYQAIHIAVHLGVKRILLVAYDMHGEHWFGRHPPEISVNRNPQMGSRVRFFAQLAPILEKMGVEVVNVTPGSIIDCFRRGDLETELRRA